MHLSFFEKSVFFFVLLEYKKKKKNILWPWKILVMHEVIDSCCFQADVKRGFEANGKSITMCARKMLSSLNMDPQLSASLMFSTVLVH